MPGRLRQLFGNLLVYGVGDTATQIVSFLLLPLYVRYLSPADYGVLALLLTTEVVVKIVFRWGIDASFMRLYYDCSDTADRQRLASTHFLFLLAANGTLLAAGLAAAPALSEHLFNTRQYSSTLQLVVLNTFITGFYYLPFHVLRIEGKPQQFIALTFGRSVATLGARLALVIGAGLGVHGVVLADVVVTALFTLVLVPWFAPLIRPTFSMALLRESLRFGLPRLPHGVSHQVIAVFDRYWLGRYVTLHEIGLYATGATFGLGLKLFLSAFEYAWAPFYFGLMREPDAKRTFARVTTYALAILVLLTAGLSAVAVDLLALMTAPTFLHAAKVIPWIAMGVTLQGVYLLTSIGLNITKRTEYYPVATAIAAGVSVLSNVTLVPSFGILGAAVANTLAYGVLAGTSFWFSYRLYPIPYESRRLARVIAAGVAAFAVGRYLVPDTGHPLTAVLARGTAVVAVYMAVLAASRFFVAGELREMRGLGARLRRRRVVEPTTETTELAGELVGAPAVDEAEVVDEPEAAAARAKQAAGAR